MCPRRAPPSAERRPGRDPPDRRHGQHQLLPGRTTRNGSAVYNLTKHGVGAFSEALRQEITGRHVRVSLVEPRAVETELRNHNRPEIQEQMRQRFGEIEILQSEDIASAVLYIVTRPWRMSVSEMLVRPTEQDA